MGVSVVVNEDNYIKLKQSAHNNRRTIGNELAMILDKHFEESTTGEFKATETKGRWGGDKAATSQPAPTPQAPLFSKPADAVKPTTKPTRYARFVEFTNMNGRVCSQRVDGTEEYIEEVFAKNKQWKPRWTSELMPSEEAIGWAALHPQADADDSFSWQYN